MLETYITPLLMSYVDKYIKNLKPSDLSLSIWGGDVVLYNLELRLDVLEKELHLPITFLSGKIHKLQIHVPWTKLVSEPVNITINTIECVIELKDPTVKHDDADKTSTLSASEVKEELDKKNLHDRGEPPPAGYVQSLVNRVANNISICVHNVVLKYVEDDIVLSLNVKSAETFSVNANWEKAFVDIIAPEYILRKVCNISDLTVCLDKKNTSGKIDMYQDPLLYKCGLSCRININYDAQLRPKSTKFNVYCECFDLSLTNEQLPLFVRLLKLCISLYYNSLDLPGCEYKPHPAAKMIEDDHNSRRRESNISSIESRNDASSAVKMEQLAILPQDDWYNWMWSFIPEATTDEAIEETKSFPPDLLLNLGIYISQVSLTLKLISKVNESTFLGAQRYQFKPLLSCEMSGVAVELILHGDEFFDAQVGVTSIMGWTLGDCSCCHGNDTDSQSIQEGEEEEEKEDMFLTVRAPQEYPSETQGFLLGSLFYAEQTTFELPKLVFDLETFIEQHSESYALTRYGAFFFDYLYIMKIESAKEETGEEEEQSGVDYVGKIRLVKEVSHKRIFLGSTHLHLTAGLLHRILSVHQFSSDGSPDRKEKTVPFYDEFVEKQLLAGNICSRHFTITLLSVNLTIPSPDHVKAGSQELLSNLHSIIEKKTSRDDHAFQPALVILIDRMEIHRNNPMYPTELSKLIIANAEFPAGKNMLHHAFNNSVIKIFSVQICISHTIPDSPVINIMPSCSTILSVKDCILPDTWGNETIKRNEAHLEVPSVSLCLTKAQFLMLSHMFSSWSATVAQNKELPVLSKAVLGKIFDSPQNQGSFQSQLELNMTNTDIQYCSTSVVMATTSSIGTINCIIKSKGEADSDKQLISTPVVKGPCDTSEIYKGTLFSTSTYHEDRTENLGPVISFTLQLPRNMEKKDENILQGLPQNTAMSSAILLHVKGLSVCLDPLLYSWLAYQPSPTSSSSGLRIDKDRRKKQAYLTRTPSIGTPRKKSFARGSVTSPSKDKTITQEKSAASKQNDSNSTLESTDALTFEGWLFDKLPLITSFAVQVDVRSIVIFVPEKHVSQAPHALSIAQNLAFQSWKSKSSTFPTSLVLCLPSLEICSANHNKVSFRPSLPIHFPKQTGKDVTKRDSLPWTLSAKNLAVYTVHSKTNPLDSTTCPVYHYLVSPVSCTAVLASAKTSTPSSPTLSPHHRPGSRVHRGTSKMEGHKSPTLGFCVHADFEPLVVSSSRKQIKLLANLVESLLLTVLSPSTSSADVTTCPQTPGPVLQRTVSVTSSSSAVEHVEQESVLSPTESSFSFTQINQPTLQDVKVSLWLQWTLPRFIVELYSHTSRDSIPVCVTADLEDLTAFIDYQETHLQMQYKVGAFNVTHTMKRDSSWLPGPFGGILFSCKDILSYKASPLGTSPRLPSTGNQHDGPTSGPHGFLNITYNRSSLHLKRRHSHSEKTVKDSSIEECFKIQHEVRLNVQSFDVVLWSPAIVAAIDVFDARLLGKLRFLSHENPKPIFDLDKETKNRNENITLSASLLPLLFMNMRDIRLFLPCSQIIQSKIDPTSEFEDLVIIHLSTVTATPHPDNPIARSVLDKVLHDKFRTFGRSSRHALGYDLHEVQYQTAFSGFGIWTAKWKELCGNLNKQSDVANMMDQNPALEWNTQLWRSAKEVHISPLLTGTDFKIVLAPAVTMERTIIDVKNTPNSLTDSIPVCGWSVELNFVNSVDFFLNRSQILLLQTLVIENIEALYCCELMSSLNQGTGACTDSKMAALRDADHIDSGLGSSHTEPIKPPQKAIPFEVFVAARNITIRMYLRRAMKRRRSQHGSTVSAKEESVQIRTLATKPVLEMDFVQPAVTFKSHALGPRLQLWCYDVSVLGSLIREQGWLHKSLPEASDYNIECLRTGLGLPDPHTGVMPSLVAVDARNLTNGATNVSIDIGRPVKVTLNMEMVLEVTRFFDDFVVQSDTTTTMPEETSPPIATNLSSPVLKYINVTTRDLSLELSTIPRDDYPKVLLGMSGNRGSIRIKYGEQGKFPRLDANLESEGVEICFLLHDQLYYLVRPFTLKCELEMVKSPHSLTQIIPSMPQICSRISIGLLQIEFGQQHMNCITTLSKVMQEILKRQPVRTEEKERSIAVTSELAGDRNSGGIQDSNTCRINGMISAKSIRAEAELGFEILEEKDTEADHVKKPEVDGVKQTLDDLRAGPFKYIMISGEVGLHHPEPYEILFTTDTRDRPPTMVWRYPEPRALSVVEVLPLPFTSPVLINTLNMGDELRVPCVLSYWDNLQQCYIVYKEFYISEVSSCNISLPDPLTSDPATVILAEEWQMIVDASVDIDYPDDQSLVEEDSGSSYSSPYRSLISATSLAASVKINSIFSPSLIPAVSVQVSISMFEIKLLNHTQKSQVLPKRFAGYTLDSSVPSEQEFCLFTIEGLSGVTKHLGGRSAVTMCHYEWNCHLELLDFGDLTYRQCISPFDASITSALFHRKTTETNEQACQRSIWLEAGVDIGNIESVVSQTTVHTVALVVDAWTRDAKRQDETTLLCHYIICNDTNETIRLGQVDTDESIVLSSRHVLPYSWRISRSVKLEPKLHVCFESEGDWRWSEPFDIDSLGVCSRTIHHKLHSATLLIDVRALSGIQRQVIFRGGLQIASRLTAGIDLQILKSPNLGTSHKEKTSFQIHEDISLPPSTTLPSYIVSHAGLVGMRIRIPNRTTWCEALPLDYVEREDCKAQHLIVQLLGVKTFQTFYLWYSVEKTIFDQIQITLSPLFIMRSHLPDPVFMNVFSAKTNNTTSLEVVGKGQEEQLLDLAPNTWHHLTFQFESDGKTSDPSVPLNTTLVDLANKVNPNACDKVDTPLDSLWPYCGVMTNEKNEASTSQSAAQPPLVRYVRGRKNEVTIQDSKSDSHPKVWSPLPDVELQCRVIKKWHDLSTLIIDVIPWCLFVNKTVSTLYVKDMENKVEIVMLSGQTIAPYKFKDKVRFGTNVASSQSISWSKPLTFPSSNQNNVSSTKEPSSSDDAHHVTINIAHVTTSSRPTAVTWVMTSRICHGVRVVSVQEKFCVINSTGKPLVLLPALAAAGRKISPEVLGVERALPLSSNDTLKVPISSWDIALTSSVVLDEEGVGSLDDTSPVVFFALGQQEFQRQLQEINEINQKDSTNKFHTDVSPKKWSQVCVIDSEIPRSMVAVSESGGCTTVPLVITAKVVSGVTHLVVAVDLSPRLVLYNDCPFTIQFGQATPPQSPSYRKGSSEKVIVVEQLEPLYEVPEIPAFGMTHYELPIMREWFKTSSEVQNIPNIHIQALYNVTVAEISEDSEARISPGQPTEVPQGWSHGFDISTTGYFVVNLPGRGRVIVFVSKSRLCTVVRIKIYDDNTDIVFPPSVQSPQSCDILFNVSKLDLSLVNVHNLRKPSEVLRTTISGITLSNSPWVGHSDGTSSLSELSLTLNSFQLDNQLEGELFQFPVVVLANENYSKLSNTSSQKKLRVGSFLKPFLSIKIRYEPANTERTFLHSVVVSCEPVTVFLEDILVYRLAVVAESFLPPTQDDDLLVNTSCLETRLLIKECSSILNPLVIGEFDIQPVTIHLTLHASAKLFIAMDDTSLNLGQFHICPVYAPTSTFAQKVFYHYMSSVLFKIGWVVGSLELLGNPAGLIRNFSQGLADFFFLPYDGLTRGPSAFVSGMSQGVSSFVRHVSTGALTSVTNLASSISRNLDRLCMDEDHIRLLEEQRCRRPTRLMTGITQGLSGFGLSLLGAVAGVVDQPIQGIQRANDVKQAATGVLTGVGKGLLGVITKPIGGAMELVSQTGQGILQGTGLSHLPLRLHPVEEVLVIQSRNSHLKYLWKVLQFKSYTNLVLCVDVTMVTATGHDYSGALLLTSNTLYIASSAVDAIQQTLNIRYTDVHEDEHDNRSITVTTVLPGNSFEDDLSEIPETGDRERMEQFLRDSQMFAQASQADTSADDSPESVFTSKLKFILDPVLRDTVVSRFKTAKSKLMVEVRQ